MRKLFSLAVLAALMATCTLPALGQDTGEATAQRKARILANLRFLFPQLAQYDVQMGELGPSGLAGLDEGSFVLNGQQQQRFLVTPDDTQLYLLTAGPFDVSKTPEALAAAEAEREAEAARAARALHAELEQAVADLPARGNPDAPVTIVEFSDFQCPYCARATDAVEQVLEKYPADVRFVFVHFPLPNHAWAKPAAIAAVCAAAQEPAAFWAMHDRFFDNQEQVNPGNVLEQSKAFLIGTGIDMEAWSACASDTASQAHQDAAAEVDEAIALGRRLDVTGTPAFFVNGRFVNGVQPLETFEALIEAARRDP